jgi:hypothetical protein
VVGDSQVAVPTGLALTVTEYAYASAMLVVWANDILAVVEIGNYIRFGVVLAGEIMTLYSMEVPQYMEVAVNEILFVGSTITFWLFPSIAVMSMFVMLHTAGLKMALIQVI